MSDQERIAALEQELAQLRAAFADYAREHQYILGQAQAYDAAVEALIESHPDPEYLGPALQHHLSQVEANVVAQANTEERLQGLQDAQQHLTGAFETLELRHAKIHTPP